LITLLHTTHKNELDISAIQYLYVIYLSKVC
jgi:hypothetical protein